MKRRMERIAAEMDVGYRTATPKEKFTSGRASIAEIISRYVVIAVVYCNHHFLSSESSSCSGTATSLRRNGSRVV